MTNPIEDFQRIARDSFYVTIGLGVIAFQKAQVRRQELTKELDKNVSGARELVDDQVKMFDERLAAAEERLDEVLDDVQRRLPDQAATAMAQARSTAKDARNQMRSIVQRSESEQRSEATAS